MKIFNTNFYHAKIIIPDVHEDNRGFFKEIYRLKDHIENQMFVHWLQDAVSYTEHKNTIRGLHMQGNMAKLVTVLSGKVYDVIVDMNEDSPTYGDSQGFYLSAENHKQLFIPPGFLHGFLSLTDNVVFHYKMSEFHNSENENSYHWNNERFDIKWPLLDKHVIISEKDSKAQKAPWQEG